MTALEAPDRLTPEQAADILAKHEAMCWSIARKYGRGFTVEDLEDLAAEARRWFVRASKTFDPSTGLQFSTFAYTAAVGNVRRLARSIRARGTTLPSDPTVPTPEHVDFYFHLGNGLEIGDTVAAPEAPERIDFPPDFWDRVQAELNQQQFACVWLRFAEGLTFQQSGKLLGVSRARVAQVVDRAAEVLRESGLFDEYRELL